MLNELGSQAETISSVLLGFGIEASCLADEVRVDPAQDVPKRVDVFTAVRNKTLALLCRDY